MDADVTIGELEGIELELLSKFAYIELNLERLRMNCQYGELESTQATSASKTSETEHRCGGRVCNSGVMERSGDF